MTTVLVADDHSLVREGLTNLLAAAPDLELVGAAGDGAEAVELASAATPDVVLMDLSMPGLDGIEATRRILERQPGAKVVVLTSFCDEGRILAALDAGAVGYLLKDSEPDELLRGIRAAAQGESPLAAKVAGALILARTSGTPELTFREREVLVLLAGGMANKHIARRLGITEKTVKAHLTNVFSTIGVTSRTQAALWAQRSGLAS